MNKIKKLWKVLSGTVSWNIKAPDMNASVMKDSKKHRQKEAHHAGLKKGIAE